MYALSLLLAVREHLGGQERQILRSRSFNPLVLAFEPAVGVHKSFFGDEPR